VIHGYPDLPTRVDMVAERHQTTLAQWLRKFRSCLENRSTQLMRQVTIQPSHIVL